MLRHLIRNFSRSLQLQRTPANIFTTNVTQVDRVIQRTLFHVERAKAKSSILPDSTDTPTEPDGEYIVPYRHERENPMTSNVFIETLRTRFRLSANDVKRIMSDDVVNRSVRERSLIHTMELLCSKGVTKSSFVEYPWLIALDANRLEKKLTFIYSMPVRDINHFVPFLRLTVPRLGKLVNSLNREADIVPTGNRIYYLSQKLNVEPAIITKYLSKRLFILEMPFDMFEQNLQHMIDYNVSPLNLLKDLWAFRYTPKSVQLRLERAKRAKKVKIMPWMVRCPEPILQRSLKLSLDELAVLGGKTSTFEYIAERLQFTVEEAKAIMAKHPQVNRVRVTKIKDVLDYLLDVEGFTRYEIAQVPRILCHSLKTTKQRLEELKSLGCRPSTLVIVCRSKREYTKFVTAWKRGRRTSNSDDQTNEASLSGANVKNNT